MFGDKTGMSKKAGKGVSLMHNQYEVVMPNVPNLFGFQWFIAASISSRIVWLRVISLY